MIKLTAFIKAQQIFNGLKAVYKVANANLNARQTEEELSQLQEFNRNNNSVKTEILETASNSIRLLKWNNKKDVRLSITVAVSVYLEELSELIGKAITDAGWECDGVTVSLKEDWCWVVKHNKSMSVFISDDLEHFIQTAAFNLCLDMSEWRKAAQMTKELNEQQERDEAEEAARILMEEQELEIEREEGLTATPERKAVMELDKELDLGLTFEQRWEAEDKLKRLCDQSYRSNESWLKDLRLFVLAGLQTVMLVNGSTLLNGRSLRWAFETLQERLDHIEMPRDEQEHNEDQDQSEDQDKDNKMDQHDSLENGDTGASISEDNADGIQDISGWTVTHKLGTALYYVAMSAVIGYYWSCNKDDAHVFNRDEADMYMDEHVNDCSGEITMHKVHGIDAVDGEVAKDMVQTLVSMGFSEKTAEIIHADAEMDLKRSKAEVKKIVIDRFYALPMIETQAEMLDRVECCWYWLRLHFIGTEFGEVLETALDSIEKQSRKCRTVKSIDKWRKILINTTV